MLKRFLTSIVIMIFTVGFFALRFVSPYFFDAFIFVIAVMSTFEVSRVMEKGGKKNNLYIAIMFPPLTFLALMFCIANGLGVLAYFGISVGIIILLFATCLIINTLQKGKNNKQMVEINYMGTYKNYVVKKSLNSLFLIFYPAFILSLLFFINHLTGFSYFQKDTAKIIEFFLLVLIFATTIVTDTGAYLIGSGIGGTKLCPKISPKKTISGAVGGLVCSVAISLIMFPIFSSANKYATLFNTLNFNIWLFLLYGILASIFSQFGDIFASVVKRKNDVKDYGNIFPGHGGFMDRVDGISFNAIFTVIFVIFVFL